MGKIAFSLLAVSCSLLAQADNPASRETNPLSGRWVALTTASVGFRYIGVTSDFDDADTFSQGQHQTVLGGEFRFDNDGKYALKTLLTSGVPFNAGWNNSDLGAAPGLYRIYWKQFYLSANPIRGVEFQFGGLGLGPGAFSDIIGYSSNGYVTGGRLTIQQPKALFFDNISVTYGFLGDLTAPDMSSRFRRLDQVNFRQYLVTKRVAPGVEASFQYTNQWGIKTLHQGVRVSTSGLRVIDSLRLEFYQRVNHGSDSGFNYGAGKKISRRFAVEAGYTSIDRNFGDLNVDAFIDGNRVYTGGEFHAGNGLRFFGIFNHGVNNNYDLPNRTHVHFGFAYDVVKALQRSKI